MKKKVRVGYYYDEISTICQSFFEYSQERTKLFYI